MCLALNWSYSTSCCRENVLLTRNLRSSAIGYVLRVKPAKFLHVPAFTVRHDVGGITRE
jgi:hypothetical protein